MKWFLLAVVIFLLGASVYQARVIKKQGELIKAMLLDKNVPCDNNNESYQKNRRKI